MLRVQNVEIEIRFKIGAPTGAYARLGCQMEDQLRFFEPARFKACNQAALEPEAGRVQTALEILELEAGVVILSQSIHAHYFVAVREQSLTKMRADETRAAGDQNSHYTSGVI